MNTIDELEYKIYKLRSMFYDIPVSQYCSESSKLLKEYFELTGKEFIPCLIKD